VVHRGELKTYLVRALDFMTVPAISA
jgi:hypothetical protein